MNVFKKKLKELVYSLSTEDHYAEYDPNADPGFNMGRRVNQGNPVSASRVHLNSVDELGDEEMNIGLENGNQEINIDEFENTDKEGVSEVLLAWRHIDSWTTEHNPDLNATLGDPCTHNDITHAEEDLAIAFPAAVRVSLRIHDGQEDLESMTGVSGLIYGLQLMTLDQVVEMTEKWRSVAKNLSRMPQPDATMSPSTTNSAEEAKRRQFKLPHIPEQKSLPPNAIQPVYAHPAWIPLLTDNAGNHVGVDLAPGPEGEYAQVIIFGRDFDTKYVVAKNWGDFLLDFANDLEAGNWYLIDDNDDYFSGDGELVFRDKKSNGPVQDYLEVLKKRALIKSQESTKNSENVESVSPFNTKDKTQISKTVLTDDNSTEEDIITTRDLPESEMNQKTEAKAPVEEQKSVKEQEDAEKDRKIEKIKEVASSMETGKASEEQVKSDEKGDSTSISEDKSNAEESAQKTDDTKVESLKEEFKNVEL